MKKGGREERGMREGGEAGGTTKVGVRGLEGRKLGGREEGVREEGGDVGGSRCEEGRDGGEEGRREGGME